MLRKWSICFLLFMIMNGFVNSQQESRLSVALLFEKGFFLETVENDLSAAVQVYEAVLALEPKETNLKARTYYRLGECLRQQGKEEKARDMFKKVIDLFPAEKKLADKARYRLINKKNTRESEDIHYKLNRKITVEFNEAPIMDVLMKTSNNFNLSIMWTHFFQKSDKKVSIKVTDIKLESFLKMVVKMQKGDCATIHGTFVVGTPEEIARFRAQVWKNPTDLPVWAAKLEQTLIDTRVDCEFIMTPFYGIINYICGDRANLVFNPGYHKNFVNLRARQISSRDVVRLACMQTGNHYYYMEQAMWIVTEKEYEKMIAGEKMKSRRVILDIDYDIPLPADFGKPYVYFINKSGIARIVASGDKIMPDTYVMEIKQPGFASIKKDIIISASSKPFVVKDTLQSLPRMFVLDLVDITNNKLVPAQKILVNGKEISSRDTFKPGIEVEIEAYFEDYQTWKKKVLIVAGKGPFILSASLQKKKNKK